MRNDETAHQTVGLRPVGKQPAVSIGLKLAELKKEKKQVSDLPMIRNNRRDKRTRS